MTEKITSIYLSIYRGGKSSGEVKDHHPHLWPGAVCVLCRYIHYTVISIFSAAWLIVLAARYISRPHSHGVTVSLQLSSHPHFHLNT